jgi:hypothetical protein
MRGLASVALVVTVVATVWFMVRGQGALQQAGADLSAVDPVRAPRTPLASVPLPAPALRSPADAEDGSACGIEPARAASAPLPAAGVPVIEQTLVAMQNSADPRARAAGLVLKPLIAEQETLRQHNPAAPCEARNCVPLPPPREATGRATAPPDADAAAPFDTVARMAAGSADPRLYGIAFHACNGANAPRGGACQLITAAQWARLDPGNAVPWAFVAAAAQAQGDAATVNEAMHQIAQARRSEHGWGVLPGLVLDHAPAAAQALEATHQLLVSAIGVESAWIIPGYQTISPFCKAEALADPNRRETCRQIAEVLAERSDTLLDRSFGASIGKRVGWPAERTDAMRAEFNALSQVVADAGVDPEQPTCAALRKSVDYIRSLGAEGELAAMRRLARR